MSLCGCYPSCSCQLSVEPPDLLALSGSGDPLTGGWLITAQETVLAISHLLGGLSVAPSGAYGHNPSIELNLDNSGNVQFSVSPVDGLRAEVVTLPSGAGGVPPGVSMSYHGTSAPAGYLLEYGQLVDIADYPDLFAAIGHVGNGGVDPGGGQFRIPEGRGLFDLGRDDMGGVPAGNVTGATSLGDIGGNEDAQLGVANLPAHTHTETGSHSHAISDPGHGHATSDPGHTHAPGTPSRSFVTVDAGFSNRDVNEATSGTPPNTRYVAGSSGGATVQALTINETTSIPQQGNTQQNNANTAAAGTGVGVVGNFTGITGTAQNTDLVTVGGGGSGAALGGAFLILPPYRVVNKIIKT